jgi:hypothetical protein
MSNKKKIRSQRIRVRAIRRDPPDLAKLGAVLIDLARAQAEADAQAEHEQNKPSKTRRRDQEPGREDRS